MNTVTLGVATRDDATKRALAAFDGQPQGAWIGFETPVLLFKVLTQKRWELLSALTGSGPVSIRDAARRVARDVKAVHGDVQALLGAGILRKTADGKIVFPFDAVKVQFVLEAA